MFLHLFCEVIVSRKTIILLFWSSLFAAAIAYSMQGKLFGQIETLPLVDYEPVQEKITTELVNIPWKGKDYTANHLYEYDLYGLVVSLRHHTGRKLKNDAINVSDICVVWGDTANSEALSRASFWNGKFTCVVKFNNSDTAALDWNKLSNNHLISNDAYLRERIQEVKVGDQIHIKGWLAQYGIGDKVLRGTSTTRTDKGNGACETIHVTDFYILKPYFDIWLWVKYIALALLIVSVLLLPRFPKALD